MSSWRRRRVIRYDSGFIVRALAEHRYELQQSKAADAEEPGYVSASSSELVAFDKSSFLPTEGLDSQLWFEAVIN